MRQKKYLSFAFLFFLMLIGSTSYFNEARLKAGAVKHDLIINRHENFDVRWNSFTSLMERSISRNLLFKDIFVDFHGAFYSLIGKKIVEDPSYTRLYSDFDFLIFPVENATEKQEQNVKNIVELKNVLEASTDFLVVIIPDKSIADGVSLPPGLESYSRENISSFHLKLKKSNIKYFEPQDITKKENYYKSDHHWKISTAFETFTQLASKFYENDSISLQENFSWYTMEKSFVGSLGRRVGKYYTPIDNFNYTLPTFDTSFEVSINYSGKEIFKRTGTFEEAIVNSNAIDDPELTTDRYAIYLSDAAKTTILNNNQKQGKTLLIKDSFGLPIGAFLSFINKETVLLDIRSFNDENRNIFDYVSINKFDKVILFYNSEMLRDPKMFNFKGE